MPIKQSVIDDPSTGATPDDVPVADASAVDLLPFDQPSRAQAPRRRVVPIVLLVVALLGGVGGAIALVGRDAPVEWDPEIRPLASFVEETRGGRFEEPVEIVFNSHEDYEAHFAIDRGEEDPHELARSVAQLRALGFVAGDLDLIDTSETLNQEGTAGFYSQEDGRIHIKGERKSFDRRMQVILVHELTHAYDFQHFDLDLADDDFANSGEEFAYRAVVEGSAQLVEEEYVLTWPEAEQEEYFNGELDGAAADEESAKELDALPSIFLEAMGMPYAVGPRFIEALRLASDDERLGRAIDRALRSLPASEEHIVRPETYLRGQKVTKVDATALEKGESSTDVADDFGQISLALLLAPHVGADRAWSAVEGWAGDATSYYREGDDGPACVRIDVEFDDKGRASAFAEQARRWESAMAGSSVEQDDERVTLDACDPGPNGPAVKDAEPSLTQSLVLRADLVNSWVSEGADVEAAACVSDHLIDALGAKRFAELDERLIANEDDEEAIAEIQGAMAAAQPRCMAGGG